MCSMSNNESKFTPESRDAARRRLRHMTASLAGVSLAAAAVLGVVAHSTLPGAAGSAVATTSVGTSAPAASNTSPMTSGSTSGSTAGSGSAVAVSGGS